MTDRTAAPDRSGAESLVQTFVDAGVRVCFTNPGTSEMHFVAALDSNPQMRCVLGLFEGVVTGAADGYGRMAGTPAAVRARRARRLATSARRPITIASVGNVSEIAASRESARAS